MVEEEATLEEEEDPTCRRGDLDNNNLLPLVS